jgi:hypothetical protein
VYALAAFDDGTGPALYVGGDFEQAGGVLSTGIAKWSCPFDRGDANGDFVLDNSDIDAFVLALCAPELYDALYPDADVMLADIDASGEVDNFDIDPFVELLAGP